MAKKTPKLTIRQQNKALAERLNESISRSLWEPRGDPDGSLLANAADVYKFLKERNLPVKNEQDVVDQLRRDNVENRDYLADMPNPPAVTPWKIEDEEEGEHVQETGPTVGEQLLDSAIGKLIGRKAVKFDTSSLTSQLTVLGKSIDQLRDVKASDVYSCFADVLDEVHSSLEEFVNILDEASDA